MIAGKVKAVPLQDEESSELSRFREEWKAELESRKRVWKVELGGQITSQTEANSAVGTSVSIKPPFKLANTPYIVPITQAQEPKVALDGLHPAITPDGKVVEQKRPQALTSALGVYKQAVQHEQAGNLDEALALYRQAFRMDPHVDRAYHREEMLLGIANEQAGKKRSVTSIVPATTTMPTAPVTQPPATEGVDDITVSLRKLSVNVPAISTGQAVVTGTLGALVAIILEQEPTLHFKPEDETQPVAVNNLPEEILLEIIHLLDPSSIERLAQVCKKARVLTLESSIWRSLVVSTYREPQIPDIETLAETINRYMFDYRRVYIEQPRVRMDGAYIAICHYVRQGLSDNHWVNISHLITYHRYLRFYPNGQVLSLLANEEHPPQSIINMLKPSLRMKGLYIGTWSLTGSTIVLSNLFDASGRHPIPGIIEEPLSHPHSHHHSHSSEEARPSRYVFVMSLGLKSRPLGRWNRLDIHSYDTLNLETGDLTPVALKHERPFWFSKVRSYA